MDRLPKEASGASKEPAGTDGLEAIPIEQLADPHWYIREIAKLHFQVEHKQLDTRAASQRTDWLNKTYTLITGQQLSEAGREMRSAVDRLEDNRLLELNENEIREVEKSVLELPGVSDAKKKRWLRLCSHARVLQDIARSDPEAHCIYTSRDWETGKVVRMAEIHHRFFRVWNDPDYPNKLLMAPPGHGKSYNLSGQIAWEISKDPRLRCLILSSSEDMAKRIAGPVKRTMQGKSFRALHPDIRVLGNVDDQENSAKRFTVSRVNALSREPTMEAAGVETGINGRGYDRIFIDDPIDPKRVNQPGYRNGINNSFNRVVAERLRDPSRASIKIVCTPWHIDDLAGMIQRDVAEGRRQGWKIAVREFAIEDDANGNPIPLWPEKRSQEFLIHKRAISSTDWAHLYQLRVLTDAERLVSKLHYYPEVVNVGPDWQCVGDDFKKRCRNRLDEIMGGEQWLSIDPAATKGKTSSKLGIIQGAITPKGRAYIVDAWLFPANPVAVQHWIVAALSGGVWPADADDMIRKVRLPHHIDRILCEWSGGIVGMVTLWEHNIKQQLREINPQLGVSIERARVNPEGGGQNQGKTKRLSNVSGYLNDGRVQFPGDLRFRERDGRIRFECSERQVIQELAAQILDHGSGVETDLLDAVTQWVGHVYHRLSFEVADDLITPVESKAKSPEFMDPRTAALRRTLERMMDPPTEDEMEKEMQWLRLSA